MTTIIDRDIHAKERFEHDGDVIIKGRIGMGADVFVRGNVRVENEIDPGVTIKTLTDDEAQSGDIVIADLSKTRLATQFASVTSVTGRGNVTVTVPLGANVTIDSAGDIELLRDAGEVCCLKAAGNIRGKRVGHGTTVEARNVALERVSGSKVEAAGNAVILDAVEGARIKVAGRYTGKKADGSVHIRAQSIGIEAIAQGADIEARARVRTIAKPRS